MFKFYVLWSRELENLERVTWNLPPEDTVVIINTLHDDSIPIGIEFCEQKGIEYHVTESDGTPATGKNTLLEKFLESNNQYMVAIDGDDFLTTFGVQLYKDLAKHPSPPDILCLYRQMSLIGGHPELFEEERPNLYPYTPEFPFDKSNIILDYQSLMILFTKHPKYDKPYDIAHDWAINRLEFDSLIRKYTEDNEFMCRLVFHSRKAAELMKYNNEITVGEDTVQWLKLKRRALKGEIKMMRRMERGHPTYIYNQASDSVMRETFHHDWSWVAPFVDVIYNEGDIFDIPKNVSLPEFVDSEWV